MRIAFALGVVAIVWGSVAPAVSQCSFSSLEPGPSALQKKLPRQAFPVHDANGTTRFISSSGKPIEKQDEGDPHALVPFRFIKGGHPRYGYRDGAGRLKLEPQFFDAQAFSGHLAGVKDASGKWGFIDETGTVQIPFQFQAAGGFSEGLAPVDLCERCGYIDEKGKQAFASTYRRCYQFTEGVAKVQIDQKQWGFISKSGKLLAKVSQGGEFSLFSEGLMPSEKASSGVGFADKNGNFVIAPRFAFVQPFSEGLAAVKENDKWGYIDQTGKYVIPPQFCDPEDPRGGYFQEELAFACDPKTKLYGFVNRAGKYVIPPRYGRCNDTSGAHCGFDGGLASVETRTREGYLNREGRFVWSAPVGRGRP